MSPLLQRFQKFFVTHTCFLNRLSTPGKSSTKDTRELKEFKKREKIIERTHKSIGTHLKESKIKEYPNHLLHIVFDTSIDFVFSKIEVLKEYEKKKKEDSMMAVKMYKNNCNKYFLIGLLDYNKKCIKNEQFPDHSRDPIVVEFSKGFEELGG